MSNTFKPGDRVRRTTPSPVEEVVMGKEYTVREQISGVDLRLVGVTFSYDPNYFELVTAEFQKGDRVRATSKEGDDLAEFTVLHLYRDGSMTSERHYFEEGEWDFELLSRAEPPKPPLPTKPGSVIRVTEFGGYPENYIGLLTSGGWMLHPDTKPYESVSVFESFAPVFEVIYEPDN